MNDSLNDLIENVQKIIFIDRKKLEFLVASMIAGGHVMLADSHGLGKTSLARALALSIKWPAKTNGTEHTDHLDVSIETFKRIQCTVDLLPQDILGYSRINSDNFEVSFRPGPIFSHFLLCDEINLLPPKTQGSFFQAMEEKKVSIEGMTFDLPETFFIISTMNIRGSHLFPLPLPQLDRFMIQLSLGFPSYDDEHSIISMHGKTTSWDTFEPVLEYSTLLHWMKKVDSIEIHHDVLSYIVRLIRATRDHPSILTGASPRSGIKISRLVRALTLVRNKEFVTIDDVKEIAACSLAHRLELRDPSENPVTIVQQILDTLEVNERAGRSKIRS